MFRVMVFNTTFNIQILKSYEFNSNSLGYCGNSNIFMLTNIYYLLANEKYKHALIFYVYFKISVNRAVKTITQQ